MNDKVAEWIRQSDYDMDTAKFMFSGGRYAYAVFMCHLAVEKALKGLYQQRTGKMPPKTHNLFYILIKLKIKPEKRIAKPIAILKEANIVTRYPESLEVLKKIYTKSATSTILKQTEEVIQWIKGQF